jgi:hypothetical protein
MRETTQMERAQGANDERETKTPTAAANAPSATATTTLQALQQRLPLRLQEKRNTIRYHHGDHIKGQVTG